MKRTPRFLIALIGALMCLRVPASAQNRDQIDRIQNSVQVLRDLTQQSGIAAIGSCQSKSGEQARHPVVGGG